MGYKFLKENKKKILVLKIKGHWWNKMIVGISHLAYVSVRESVSDSGYGHEDIHALTFM